MSAPRPTTPRASSTAKGTCTSPALPFSSACKRLSCLLDVHVTGAKTCLLDDRILSRTYSLILDLINTQEELVALKKGVSGVMSLKGASFTMLIIDTR